jgi:hypothetical protein
MHQKAIEERIATASRQRLVTVAALDKSGLIETFTILPFRKTHIRLPRATAQAQP